MADANRPETGENQELLRDLQLEGTQLARQLRTDLSADLAFLAFLRRNARFGYFQFGPITIDVRLIEDIVERTAPRLYEGDEFIARYADDYVRFSLKLVEELRRSGRKRVDELHILLAFMRFPEGLPARVFGELGATSEQVEDFARGLGRKEPFVEEKLYSPEEAAAYLGVHVQTVRSWIRSGRLPASRLAGQRALRVRATDLQSVLEPLQPGESI